MHIRRLLQAKNVFYIPLHAEGNIKELLYHADPGSVCSILVLLSQTSAQDIVKLGKSIEFITFIPGGGVACV